MSCPNWETDIALYVGGDLPANRLARTMAHLEACAGCRELADDLHAGQMLLSELRSEPVADAMAAHVRRRVMARLSASKTRPARRYWVWALAAGLVLAAVITLPRRTATQVKLARTENVAPRIAATPAPAVNVPRRSVHRHHHAPARGAKPPQPGEPLLVQLVTDDPNIVIYWLVDSKPQGD